MSQVYKGKMSHSKDKIHNLLTELNMISNLIRESRCCVTTGLVLIQLFFFQKCYFPVHLNHLRGFHLMKLHKFRNNVYKQLCGH